MTTNIYDMADTWDDAGTTFTAIKMNATDTASNANSLLMDLQVGGTTSFRVRKDGIIESPDSVRFRIIGGNALEITNDSVSMGNDSRQLLFGASSDVRIGRDAADTLFLRRGANAQGFNLYNTYTDASNYERLAIRWNSNQAAIALQAAGTGSVRQLALTGGSAGTPGNIVLMNQAVVVGFSLALSGLGAASAGTPRIRLFPPSAGILRIRGAADSDGAGLQLKEMTAPASPSTDEVRIYAEDNGAGKTRLMALFQSGAAQQIAIEP
jgi:hypothetical protein